MKTLYKNSITYSRESLNETYRTLVKPIGIGACGILVILRLFCIFFSEDLEEFLVIGALFFIILIIYAFLFFLWFHKQLTNNEIKRYNVLYHSDQVKRDIEFNENEIKIYNLSDGGIKTLYYNQLTKIKETARYFILLIGPRRLSMFLIINKSGFTKGDSETFKEFITTAKVKSNKELEIQGTYKKTK